MIALEPSAAERREAARVALISLGRDGAIRAMVGGDAFADTQFNLATQARRQAGSTAKIATYAVALEQGWGPESPVMDDPDAIRGRAPRNVDGEYRGEIPLIEAIAESRNVATLWLAQEIGYRRVGQMAGRLGLYPDGISPGSVILGAAETTLIDLTRAYGVIAAHGWRSKPRSVGNVFGRSGQIVRHEAVEGIRVLSKRTARGMRRLLHHAVSHGTGWRAALPVRVYGKTGTSSDHRDAWFVGFDDTTQVTTGIWAGPGEGKTMESIYGGMLPARIWRRYTANLIQMKQARAITSEPAS